MTSGVGDPTRNWITLGSRAPLSASIRVKIQILSDDDGFMLTCVIKKRFVGVTGFANVLQWGGTDMESRKSRQRGGRFSSIINVTMREARGFPLRPYPPQVPAPRTPRGKTLKS